MRLKSETLAVALLATAIVQLTLGAVIVGGTQRQPAILPVTQNDLEIDRLKERQVTEDARLRALENLRLPERLAVLEKGAEDAAEIKKLTYGIIAALAASLLAQMLQLRKNNDGGGRR